MALNKHIRVRMNKKRKVDQNFPWHLTPIEWRGGTRESVSIQVEPPKDPNSPELLKAQAKRERKAARYARETTNDE